MVERPVIFNGEMVRAILAGRKTQTRRVMKVQPPEGWWPLNSFGVEDPIARTYTKAVVDRHGYMQAGPQVFGVADETWGAVSPFGQQGDRLWVRETHREVGYSECGCSDHCECKKGGYAYRADGFDGEEKWTPSIHMPRSACRLLLEITDVRVERLKDISEQDAIAEGMSFTDYGLDQFGHQRPGWLWRKSSRHDECLSSAKWAFGNLWVDIYGLDGWNSNPWVWVVEFKQVQS